MSSSIGLNPCCSWRGPWVQVHFILHLTEISNLGVMTRSNVEEIRQSSSPGKAHPVCVQQAKAIKPIRDLKREKISPPPLLSECQVVFKMR